MNLSGNSVKGLAGGYAIAGSSGAKERLPDSAIRLAASEDGVGETVGVPPRYGATIERTLASTKDWRYKSFLRIEPSEWPVHHKPGRPRKEPNNQDPMPIKAIPHVPSWQGEQIELL